MPAHFDTIVAPITGGQTAAVAVIRVSGPSAWSVASSVFTDWPGQPESHRAHYGHYVTGDDGLALPFAEGHSYTGEQAVELSVHGSRASVQLLVEACIAAGARLAEPGEFTLRAFLNGRLDLTQAEAVRDTVEADTAAQLQVANRLREGHLRLAVQAIRAEVLSLLGSVEASVDFSEEIGEFDRNMGQAKISGLKERIGKLLETADAGRIMRRGYRIAIVGPPNAGKSSLLNALLGSERAIVTELPGTTRDFVEESADFAGMPVVLIDTAGLRETEDPVEAIGVQRSRTQAAQADEVWYVYDASAGWSELDDALAGSFSGVRIVANKADLPHRECPGVEVSALTREGLPTLIQEVRAVASSHLDAPLINDRHASLLAAANEALDLAKRTFASDQPIDLASVALREAAQQLGRITGETATSDMIEQIFRDFCIGK